MQQACKASLRRARHRLGTQEAVDWTMSSAPVATQGGDASAHDAFMILITIEHSLIDCASLITPFLLFNLRRLGLILPHYAENTRTLADFLKEHRMI